MQSGGEATGGSETKKGRASKGKVSKGGHRITRAQKWAAQEARYFKLGLPFDVQRELEVLEVGLWADLDDEQVQQETKTLDDWVIGPGNTSIGMGFYECTVALYWVMENMLGQVLWERQLKGEGARHPCAELEGPPFRFSGYHLKIDAIAKQLWIRFLEPPMSPAGVCSLTQPNFYPGSSALPRGG